MSTYESAYPSLIQGVSQQPPEFMQPGQIVSQVNMVSDPVTGLRRRPGAKYMAEDLYGLSFPQLTVSDRVEISGKAVHFKVNAFLGDVSLWDDNGTRITGFVPLYDGTPYLKANSSSSIQYAVVNNELFLANTERIPEVQAGTAYPYQQYGGAFYDIKAGTAATEYDLVVTFTAPGWAGKRIRVTYTTPDGTTPGDASQTTPAYISGMLFSALRDALIAEPGFNPTYFPDVYSTTAPSGFIGTTIAFAWKGFPGHPDAVATLTTSLNNQYLLCCNGYLPSAELLPAKFPAQAVPMIIATGSATSPTYYQFNQEKTAWLECGAPSADYKTSSAASIMNCPVSIKYSSGTWSISDTKFEGRLAGDTVSCPDPAFVKGITGIGSFQGRLVILAGSTVCMSASTKPRRFFRTTVTSLLAGDVIEVSNSSSNSSTYTGCTQFQHDFLVFGSGAQAVIPGGNPVTPQTAMITVLGDYAASGTARPISSGNSVLAAKPSGSTYSGFLEIVPDSAIATRFSILDATPHIPSYIAGTVLQTSVAASSGYAFMRSSGDLRTLFVNQFLWTSKGKEQQAWHKWVFPFDIMSMHASGGYLWLWMYIPSRLSGELGDVESAQLWRVNLKSVPNTADTVYLDGWSQVTAVSPYTYPVKQNGELLNTKFAGARVNPRNVPIGYADANSQLAIDALDAGTQMYIGIPFESSFSTPEVMVRKQDGTAMLTDAQYTVVDYTLYLANSGKFTATVSTQYSSPYSWEYSAATTDYPGFTLPGADYPKSGPVVVPVRQRASCYSIEYSADGVQDLNVKSIVYTLKYHQRIRRI